MKDDLFIFIIMFDIPSFKGDITSSKKNFDLSCEVLYETIKDIAKNQIKLDFDSFKYHAEDYVWTKSYRKNLNDYLDN